MTDHPLSSKSEFERVYICDADLKEGEMRGVKVILDSSHLQPDLHHQWVLVVNFKNRYYALDAACSHSGYPLHHGKLDGKGVITCPLHYAKFQCETGQVVSDPAICESQPTFEIEIFEGKVFLLRGAEK